VAYPHSKVKEIVMPLSPAAARQPIHHRSINCKGYQREDGLWDIEAHLRDNKFVPFHTQTRGDLSPEDAVHDMWIRLTVDDEYLIHDLEAVIDASPFVVCPEITQRFQLLKGLRIGAGWNKMLKELLGDVKGCTHLVELFGPLATTAFQTIYPQTRAKHQQELEAHPNKKPILIDSCHAFDSKGVVVKQYFPKFYTGKQLEEELSSQ
jgi:hypothetical protein